MGVAGRVDVVTLRLERAHADIEIRWGHSLELVVVGEMLTALKIIVVVLVAAIPTGCRPRAELVSSVERAGASEIYFEPSRIDLGVVRISSEHRFEAKIVNLSDALVDIGRLRTDCGCAEVHVDKTRLLAGEETWMLGQFRAPNFPIEARKRIVLELDAGRTVVAHVEADVQAYVTYSPERIVLRPDVLRGLGDVSEVVIENRSDRNVKVFDISVSDECCEAEVSPQTIQTGGHAKATIYASPSAIVEKTVHVTIRISHPVQKGMSFVAYIQPVHRLQVLPEAFHLGVIRESELLRRGDLCVRFRGELLGGFSLEEVFTPPHIRVTKKQKVKEDDWLVRLAFQKEISKIDLGGNNSFVFVNSKRRFKVNVPLTGFLDRSYEKPPLTKGE